MNALQGTVKHGQVVLDGPAELLEGTRVEVLLVQAAGFAQAMRDDDSSRTPGSDVINVADLAKRDEEIFNRRIIHAIKGIRDATGRGIHDSIELLQARYERLRESRPSQFSRESFGVFGRVHSRLDCVL